MRHGWLDNKGGDNRITKYDLVDILMERYPPDVDTLTTSGYSHKQIQRMLIYSNSANPAPERCLRYFQNMEPIDSYELRMYLYGEGIERENANSY